MKKKLFFAVGYSLLGVAALVGILLNVITLVQGGGSGLSVAEMIVFLAVFVVIAGISGHQAVLWILRIVKDREINQENQ
jgi:hypothetical protein